MRTPWNRSAQCVRPGPRPNQFGRATYVVLFIVLNQTLRAEDWREVRVESAGLTTVVRYQVDECSATVTFDASGSTGPGPRCRIKGFHWWFGERRANVTPESRRASPTYQYRTPGDYRVTLSLWDGCRNTETTTFEVRVPPIPSAPYEARPVAIPSTGVSAGQPVLFQAVVSDANEDGLIYAWDFGDGSPIDTRQNPTHIFDVVGQHEVVLSVEGLCGGVVTAATEVAVGADGNPPTVDGPFQRVPETPDAWRTDSFDSAGQTAMELPEPVVCLSTELNATIARARAAAARNDTRYPDSPQAQQSETPGALGQSDDDQFPGPSDQDDDTTRSRTSRPVP